MTGLEKYKRNIIVKALIIPLTIVIIVTGAFLLSLPEIQENLPNGVRYSTQESSTQTENGAMLK